MNSLTKRFREEALIIRRLGLSQVLTNSIVVIIVIWAGAKVLSFLLLFFLQRGGREVTYTADALGQLSSASLAVTGVLIAVLFAVLNAVNGQSRDNHFAGGEALVRGISSAEKLRLQLKRRVVELSSDPLVVGASALTFAGRHWRVLVYWLADLERLVSRVTSITMNWRGYDADPTIENELLAHVLAANAVEDSSPLDNGVAEMNLTFDASIREILLGLRRLDEAVLAERLVLRLSAIMGSLVTLTAFGLVFRFGANVGVVSPPSQADILENAVFLSANVVFHLFALVIFVSQLWYETRKRDAAWVS